MTELDAVERALQLARGELSASDATIERVWRRLPVPAFAAAPVPRGTWAALKATGAGGALVAAALVGSGFGLGFWARAVAHEVASAGSPPPVEAAAMLPPAPAPVVVVPAAPAPLPAPAPLTTTPAPSARLPARRATPSRALADGAEQELALLARVERALRNDDAALALVLLDELEQRFPDTGLGEERAAARLMCHCLQKRGGAGEAAHAFLSEHPASVYRGRLRALCALEGAREVDSLTGNAAPDTDGR